MSKTSKANHHQQLAISLQAKAHAALRAQRAQIQENIRQQERQQESERKYYYDLFLAERDRQWLKLEKLFGAEMLEALNMTVCEFSYQVIGEPSPVEFSFEYAGEVWRLDFDLDGGRCINITLPDQMAFGFYHDTCDVQRELLILLAEWDEDHGMEIEHVS